MELHDREPPLEEQWEDAVEASFSAADEEIALSEWGGSEWHPLLVPAGDYRDGPDPSMDRNGTD